MKVLLAFLFAAAVIFALLTTPTSALTVEKFPHYQTFDSWPECYELCTCYEQACTNLDGGWVNEEFAASEVSTTGFDMRDWWVKSGVTSSNTLYSNGTTVSCEHVVTGPCGDATSGSGNYLYAEASGCFGSHFRIRSPYVRFTERICSIGFSYYLYGIGIAPNATQYGEVVIPASLGLYVSFNNGSTWTTLKYFDNEETQHKAGDPWLRTTIPFNISEDIPMPAITIFRFEAITSGNFYGYGAQRTWEGDMAIDDVLITQFNSSNITTPYIDPPINYTYSPSPHPNNPDLGDGGGLSTGAIVGIAVGIAAGLCCLCLLLLLLGIAVLFLVSPRKPPASGGEGDGM